MAFGVLAQRLKGFKSYLFNNYLLNLRELKEL
jgi:hypothetical protein